MRALARLALVALAGAVVGMAPDAAVGQEVGSDVQMPSATEIVSSASLFLVAGSVPAATPQAFAAAVQATVTQALVDPRGETRARSQLGDFRTSILMKAGVLSFDGAQARSRVTDGRAEPRRPAWVNRPLVFVSPAALEAAARRPSRRN